MRYFIKLFYLITLLFSYSCFSMTIMSYNVENLFDTQDDPNTKDEQFLPKNHAAKKNCRKNKNKYRQSQCLRFNWDEKQFKQKIKKLAKVINSSAQSIDVLGLVEVENQFVIEELNKQLDKPFNKLIAAPSSDERGIRAAILIRTSDKLNWKSSKEWEVNLGKKKTRTILEARVKWKKKDYCFFVNHWPSQGSQTPARIKAAKALVNAVEKTSCVVIAMGDFNTLEHEAPDPFGLLENAGLEDLTSKLRKQKDILGTYFFGPKLAWNYLDRFFVSKKVAKTIQKDDLTIVVSKDNSGVWEELKSDSPLYGSRVVGTPKRFKAGGVSDHFPIILRLR